MLFNIIFRHWNCFLLSVAMDGKDKNGLKLENIGPNFSSCNANLNLLAKLTPLPATKKNFYCGWHSLIKFVCYLLHNSTGAFCVGVKVMKKWFQYRIDLKQHYPHTNSPNWSLYISLKNKLREFDKRSKHFLLGDHFINSHNLISWQCMDIVRRKLMLVTIGT